jgi:hypothetical protein
LLAVSARVNLMRADRPCGRKIIRFTASRPDPRRVDQDRRQRPNRGESRPPPMTSELHRNPARRCLRKPRRASVDDRPYRALFPSVGAPRAGPRHVQDLLQEAVEPPTPRRIRSGRGEACLPAASTGDISADDVEDVQSSPSEQNALRIPFL